MHLNLQNYKNYENFIFSLRLKTFPSQKYIENEWTQGATINDNGEVSSFWQGVKVARNIFKIWRTISNYVRPIFTPDSNTLVPSAIANVCNFKRRNELHLAIN